jgi:uncharacterized protein YcfL
MKSRKIITLIYLLPLLIISGCSSSKNNVQAMNNLIGEVEIVGNEPFTNLALRVDSAKIYILKCDNKTRDLLEKNQGKMVKIYYKSIDKSQRPNILIVDNAVIIKDGN